MLGNAQQSIGIGGGAVGVDYTWAPGMLSGIALGGSDGSFNVGSRQTSGSTTGGHAAFFTLFGNRTTRTVAGFGGLNSEILRGNFTSTEFRTRVEFGYRFGVAPGVTLRSTRWKPQNCAVMASMKPRAPAPVCSR